MGFIAHYVVERTVRAQHVADVVVQVLGLIFPRWNRVDVDIEYARSNVAETDQTGFLLRLFHGDRKDVRITVRVAT